MEYTLELSCSAQVSTPLFIIKLAIIMPDCGNKKLNVIADLKNEFVL